MTEEMAVDVSLSRSKVLAALSALPDTTTHARSALLEELTASALAGRDLPDDIVSRIAADRLQAESVAEARSLLSEVAARVNAAGVEAERRQVPARLRTLDTRVREIQAEVADLVPQLGGVRSAVEAMRSGDDQVAAWRRLLELEGEYAKIRQQQGALSTMAGGAEVRINAEVIAKFGIMANVDEVWPARVAVTIGRSGTLAPWPHPQDEPWQISHDLGFLIWAVGAGAELWVPTVAQLDEAFQDSVRAGNKLRSEHGEQLRRSGRAVA